jgi:adenylate cyclase
LLRIKMAVSHLVAMYRWSDDPAKDAAQYRKLIAEAARLLGQGRKSRFEEFYLHYLSSWAYQYDADYERCIAEAEAAVSLSPYDPLLLSFVAQPLAECGKPAEAVALAKEAVRLAPDGLPGQPEQYKQTLVWTLYLADRCSEAIGVIRDLKSKPLETLAACHVRLGQVELARSAMASFVKDNPGWTLKGEQAIPIQMSPKLRQRWFEDIRTACLPEK